MAKRRKKRRDKKARRGTPPRRPASTPAAKKPALNIPAVLLEARRKHNAGELRAAIELYEHVLHADKDNHQAWQLLGMAALQAGLYEPAAKALAYTVERGAATPGILSNLGLALTELGRAEAAVAFFEQALAAQPEYVDAWYNLGRARAALREAREAVRCYDEALRLQPQDHEAWNNRGNALADMGDYPAAEASFRRALELREDYANAHYNLGKLLLAMYRIGESIRHTRRALSLRPGHADTLINLGNALKTAAQVREAEDCYRQALAADPACAEAGQNLLLLRHYWHGDEPAGLKEEHADWARQHTPPPASRKPIFDNDPDRRLRIGYVSGDLCEHSVAHFIEPLLRAHDREQVEVIAYGNVQLADAVTLRLQGLCDRFVDIAPLSDDAAAERMRADEVDILVDLAGHTRGNRLLLFARRCAPVQVTWLGYPATTGLDTMDYSLTDAVADPPGAETHYTETLLRLPGGFHCYLPPADAPAVAPPGERGHIAFGCFGNLTKLSPACLDVWAEVLRAVPESRLCLKSRALLDSLGKGYVLEQFARRGIGAERLELLAPRAEKAAHLFAYGNVDIALDTIPYNGVTTTCEALYMGVPVLTLAGTTRVARMGASLLQQAGLDELVAPDREGFVALARDLAQDKARRDEYRETMRARLQASPLMNAAGFARSLEEAYRRMWRKG